MRVRPAWRHGSGPMPGISGNLAPTHGGSDGSREEHVQDGPVRPDAQAARGAGARGVGGRRAPPRAHHPDRRRDRGPAGGRRPAGRRVLRRPRQRHRRVGQPAPTPRPERRPARRGLGGHLRRPLRNRMDVAGRGEAAHPGDLGGLPVPRLPAGRGGVRGADPGAGRRGQGQAALPAGHLPRREPWLLPPTRPTATPTPRHGPPVPGAVRWMPGRPASSTRPCSTSSPPTRASGSPTSS